jgi:hypothetical protein
VKQIREIEIKPGVFIQVSMKVKEKAGALGHPLRPITREDVEQAAISLVPTRRRKYSRLLVDEAVELSKKIGRSKAAKRTGVHVETISQRQRIIRGTKNCKYTRQQIEECIRTALHLMKREGVGCKDKAFAEAGRRLGISGLYILQEWRLGVIRDLPSNLQAPLRRG